MNRSRTSRSTGDLRKVYRYSDDINRSRNQILVLIWTAQNRGATLDRIRTNRIENLRQRMNRLSLLRHDEIMRVYSNVALNRQLEPLPPERRRSPSQKSRKSRAVTASVGPVMRIRLVTPEPVDFPVKTPPRTRSPTPELQVKHIVIEPDITTIDMLPTVAQSKPADHDDDTEEEEEEEEGNDIVFPDGITDRRPYITIARYRRAIKQPTDFSQHPLQVAMDSAETLILGLESFAQQHGCDLIFSEQDQRFDKSIFRAVCGVIDLGSIHLLASDSILTANFQFEIDLDYDREITQSKENVEQFVDNFCQAISDDLVCDKNSIRVFSIDKLTKKSGRSHVNFGLTTSDKKKTERLARTLQVDFEIFSQHHDSSDFSRNMHQQDFQRIPFFNMSNKENMNVLGSQH